KTIPTIIASAGKCAASRGQACALQPLGTTFIIAPVPFLTVIIPCYNERDTVARVVERVHASAPEAEILVVDDGSSDGSREVLNALETDHPEYVRVLFHEQNGGKGAALHTGIEAATGEVIL